MVDLVRDKLDKNKTTDGVWVTIDDFGEVLIRRWNNPEYVELALKLRDMKREEKRLAPEDAMDGGMTFPIVVEAACHTVIKNWRGVEADGQPVPYTPEVGIQAFNDPDDSWLTEFNAIIAAANDRTNYRKEQQEALTKNS